MRYSERSANGAKIRIDMATLAAEVERKAAASDQVAPAAYWLRLCMALLWRSRRSPGAVAGPWGELKLSSSEFPRRMS